jgi:hypothetical protein
LERGDAKLPPDHPDSAFKYMTRLLYEAGSQNKSKSKRNEYSAYSTSHVARTFDENFQGKEKSSKRAQNQVSNQ